MLKRRISIVDYPHLSQYSSRPSLRTMPTRQGISPARGTIDSFDSPKMFFIDSEFGGAKGVWLLKKEHIPRCTALKVP